MILRPQYALFIFSLFITNIAYCQDVDTSNPIERSIFDTLLFDTLKVNKIVFMNKDSNIFEVVQDSRLYDLLEKNVRISIEKENKMPGYRVQIFASSVRKKSDLEKSKFLSLFPTIKAHTIYEPPNYKVRIGDFKTRLDAQKALDLIHANFQESYIVRDEITTKKKKISSK